MHQIAPQSRQNPKFREARRIQQSFLANLEKRTLIWLAAHTPEWINSDHLTLLGLLSMASAGGAYWWSSHNRFGLLLVIVCLALNWLGDSLDGTLARFRDHSRPRYGFYVDHIVDAFSAFFLLGGLALSGYMSPLVALGLLVAYLMLSVEVYLASYTVGDFKISYFKMGPTELRILLSIGNLSLLWKSTVHLFGRAQRFFDVAGSIGITGMLLVMVISAIHNTMRLYRQEPIPVGKQLPDSRQLPLVPAEGEREHHHCSQLHRPGYHVCKRCLFLVHWSRYLETIDAQDTRLRLVSSRATGTSNVTTYKLACCCWPSFRSLL